MDAKQRLVDLAVSESGFVFDPYTGATFSVNASGMVILHEMKQGHRREEILSALREAFVVEAEDLHRDLDEFLALLRSNGVLSAEFTLE